VRNGLEARHAVLLLAGTALAGFVALVPTFGLALPDSARGEELARKHCSGCHAIGPSGDSPNPKSPPFRTLSERYPLDDLQEALAEGIMVGHEGQEMPEFAFSPDDIADLIAHMKRVSARR
jgi:mono/diheme cytochrome c family protein